jgi:phenylalanyl-tRNA synthetase alpha chain
VKSSQNFKHQLATLLTAATADNDPAWHTKYLGKNGLFRTLAASTIKNTNDKKLAGQMLNQLKAQLEKLASTKTPTRQNFTPEIDFTLPAHPTPRGHLHPITLAIQKIVAIFNQLGFIRVRYPEVDLDENAFTNLNMAPNHPARDEWETFFVTHPGKKTSPAPHWVMTPHTSNGQVHELKRLHQPPIRMINISRCYRRQQDLTHTQMFHQFEGLMVDQGVNITHLKGVLDFFAQKFYGPGTKSRIRPFNFKFTEPSFEIDFSCHLCGGTGVLPNGEKCKFCKSGWHEVGGAGMVHPNVLRLNGHDPNKVTGFAFGWGIERTYTLQDDLQINDIRQFYNGNLQFLAQF